MKKCASGNQEIFEHRFCDGIIDCADESDEQGCSCKYNFRNFSIPVPPKQLHYHLFDVIYFTAV